MQLYALDKGQKPVSANQAVKHQDYHCIECQSKVRLRGGFHRQNHFYHLDPARSCRQNGKSMEHLQVQYYLLDQLPKGECALEKFFPEIGRIADVFWIKENIIFEIQCSPITALEVSKRNEDYAKLGLTVVWIFHDKQFNKWRLTAAEYNLQTAIHYYTNMSSEGEGMIYDQLEICHKGKRVYISEAKPIQPAKIFHSPKVESKFQIPKILKRKVATNSFYFEGDAISLLKDETQATFFAKALEVENQINAKPKQTFAGLLVKIIYYTIVRPYKLLFQIALEKASR